ncbi:hypothetical protein [Janthinobacterium sp. J1-1]|uniref:hypothetical protein n=1 Tax=unclassified Janthinobacterium TaxID=2610881 RepID=UPI0028122F25|nr:hypothetical protein [Janthinobacterium sp. J1-1]
MFNLKTRFPPQSGHTIPFPYGNIRIRCCILKYYHWRAGKSINPARKPCRKPLAATPGAANDNLFANVVYTEAAQLLINIKSLHEYNHAARPTIREAARTGSLKKELSCIRKF